MIGFVSQVSVLTDFVIRARMDIAGGALIVTALILAVAFGRRLGFLSKKRDAA